MNALTANEQENVRRALRFLKTRLRTWQSVAGALGVYQRNDAKIAKFAAGGRVTVDLAFRLARINGVAMETILDGSFLPKSMCPHCGGQLDTQD